MAECRLCPRQCGADRSRAPGLCRVSQAIRVGRAAPHFGEEPCISGRRGAGAVFFAGCPLGCAYCQNYRLSRGLEGRDLSPEELAEVFRRLEAQGVHNLELVTGTQFLPGILRALELARPQVPVVWNSSGYETVRAVEEASRAVSVFLPDLKYALEEPARRYSRAPDYPETAMTAIREMARRTGPFVLDGDGLLRRGVLIRHLVLPGNLENTRRVIRWVAETFPPGQVLFSLMAQYTPMGDLAAAPELRRPLDPEEWAQCLAWLEESSIEDGYVQELSAAGEEEIPAFDGTGVEPPPAAEKNA